MTEHGDLPSGWTLAPLRDVAAINPPNPVHVPLDDTLVSFVPMTAVEELSGRMNASTPRSWSEVKRGFTRFQDGDIVFAKITPSMENGKVALAANLFNGVAAGTTEFHVFRPQSGLTGRYLLHYLLQETFRRRARARMTGTAGQLRVPTQFLEEETLPLAPEPEQQRIVEAIDSYLSRLDDAVASLERAQTKLKAYCASVLKAAVEGRLVPTEASLARAEKRAYEPAEALLSRILKERRGRWEEAEMAKMKAAGKTPRDDKWKAKYKEPVAPHRSTRPELPEGWCWASVDQLTDGARNSAYGVLVPGPDVTDGVPLVRVGDIQDGTVSTSDLKRIDRAIADQFAKTYLSGGEVLLSLVGTIGRSAVVPSSLSGANVARAVGVIPTSSLVRSGWVEIWFRSPQVQALMNSRAHEVARKTLNLEDVRSAAVAVPPVAEQDRALAQAQNLESVAAATASLVVANSLRSLRVRQAVLKWAFEGKLVDQDPTDEPAETVLARIRAARAVLNATKQTSRTRAKGVA